MYKIFVIEDEPFIKEAVIASLMTWNYSAEGVSSFEHVLDEIKACRPDLILMDLYLPKENGLILTEKIREFSTVPILFLTSAEEGAIQIQALLKGADDYITKPFELAVLAARIQAVLRRTYHFKEPDRIFEYRGLRFNADQNTVSFKNKQTELTRNEAKILKTLMENETRIVSREDLMEAIWKTNCYIDENTLSVNIARLRKKLDLIGVMDLIHTRKGIGYSL